MNKEQFMLDQMKSSFEDQIINTEAFKLLESQNYYGMDLFAFIEPHNKYRCLVVQGQWELWQFKQSEFDELLAHDTKIDRERNHYRDQARDYKSRNALAKSLVDEHIGLNKDDPEVTLRAIQRALIGID